MKYQSVTYENKLTFSAIDEISSLIRENLVSIKIKSRDIARYTLTVEEILLKSIDSSDEELSVSLHMGRRMLRPYIRIEISGKENNIFGEKTEETGVFQNNILNNLGLEPEFSYKDGKNKYNFTVRKNSRNPITALLIALGAAVVTAGLGLLLPEDFRHGALEFLFNPIYNTFMRAINCAAGPMVFVSVAWGIYGIGDASILKSIGKKLFKGFFGVVFITTAVGAAVSLPFFNITFASSGGGSSSAAEILTMILDILPENIFSPFAEGNSLQIVFLAAVLGVSMLLLGNKVTVVSTFIEQVNNIINDISGFIEKFIPYFIFTVVVRLIWSDSIGVCLKMFKFFAVYIPCLLSFTLIYILYTSLKLKISPLFVMKKGVRTLLVALATDSSAATFDTSALVCTRKYGIDEKMISFGLPLGIVSFMPASSLSYMMLSVFFAEFYSVGVSPSWLVIMVFSCVILSIATPPVPGGAIATYAVLFLQLGIPAEAVAITLTFDALIDIINTGANLYLLNFVILNKAKESKLVNEEILRKA